MASIAFTNFNDPNPSLEDVLDKDGTAVVNTASTFSLRVTGVAWNGFIFRFTSATSDFTYNGTTPTGGTITGADVLDPTMDLVASISGIANADLLNVWSGLQNNGPHQALATMLFSADTILGSDGADTLNGYFGSDTLDGGAGNDIIIITDATLIGGLGNDIFRPWAGIPTAIHGSAQDGTGGAAEADIIEVTSSNLTLQSATITNIDGVRFTDSNFRGTVSFSTSHVGSGLSSTFAVEGSSGESANSIFLQQTSPAAVNIDLSGWQFTNWSRDNQIVNVDLTYLIDLSQVDQVIGSSKRDFIQTGGGNDTVRGGAGADEIHLGLGDDFIIFATGDATAGENISGGAGTDTVRIDGNNNFSDVSLLSIEHILFNAAAIATFNRSFSGLASTLIGDGSTNTVVVNLVGSGRLTLENLVFQTWISGTDTVNVNGSASSDDITGSAVNDTLNGNAGRDFISGAHGNDTINGGDGIDILSGEAGLDIINGGTGLDTIDGGDSGDFLRGNEGIDYIDGGSGNDTIEGGTGSDLIDGGIGNDVLRGDSEADTIAGGAGADHIAGGTGSDLLDGGADNDNILGSDGDDRLEGGAANDTMDGGTGADVLLGEVGSDTLAGGSNDDRLDGGAGNDIMRGGTYDDTYRVDMVTDRVIEIAGQGQDSVVTSVSYALAATSEVEFVRTLGTTTTAVINLTGNGFANILHGNAAANILDGGAGEDDLYGFAGNDTYKVDRALDEVFERTGFGTADVVQAAVSYALQARSEVETLRTANAAATVAISLTGNEFAQTVQGNAGSNIINGGRGNDTLTGGAGNDFFLFDTTLSATANRDSITDFVAANDTIRLDNSVFTGFIGGVLSVSAFHVGSAASAADDRIIYNSATGALILDVNGNAAGGATQFATLTTKPTITNADFVVV